MRGTQTELNGAFRESNSVGIYGSPTCGFSWAGILWPTCSSGHLSPSTSPELVDQGEERGTALDQGLMH